MKKVNLIPFLLFLLISISCKKEVVKVDKKAQSESTIKYAKGFNIINENGIKKLIIKSAYQNSNKNFEYQIKKKTPNTSVTYKDGVIEVPVKKIVVTSTTHIPMLELLNEETAIVGFPYSKFVSSEKTRALIDAGKITEVGKETSLNTEISVRFTTRIGCWLQCFIGR